MIPRSLMPSDLGAFNDQLTRVELIWIEKRIEHWLRFGRGQQERILSRSRRVLTFAPGNIFALVQWASNDYGTHSSQLDIVRATRADEERTWLSGIDPGAESLLSIHGWPKVERVLKIVDAIEAMKINLVNVSPAYWRHVHSRLTIGDDPHRYTVAQHRAWLSARALV